MPAYPTKALERVFSGSFLVCTPSTFKSKGSPNRLRSLLMVGYYGAFPPLSCQFLTDRCERDSHFFLFISFLSGFSLVSFRPISFGFHHPPSGLSPTRFAPPRPTPLPSPPWRSRDMSRVQPALSFLPCLLVPTTLRQKQIVPPLPPSRTTSCTATRFYPPVPLRLKKASWCTVTRYSYRVATSLPLLHLHFHMPTSLLDLDNLIF